MIAEYSNNDSKRLEKILKTRKIKNLKKNSIQTDFNSDQSQSKSYGSKNGSQVCSE